MKKQGLKKRWGKTLLILTAALCLSACGNKGDLYLPDEPTEETASASG